MTHDLLTVVCSLALVVLDIVGFPDIVDQEARCEVLNLHGAQRPHTAVEHVFERYLIRMEVRQQLTVIVSVLLGKQDSNTVYDTLLRYLAIVVKRKLDTRKKHPRHVPHDRAVRSFDQPTHQLVFIHGRIDQPYRGFDHLFGRIDHRGGVRARLLVPESERGKQSHAVGDREIGAGFNQRLGDIFRFAVGSVGQPVQAILRPQQ